MTSAVGAGPSRGGDDSSHRKDAPPAGCTAGVPVSFNDSNQPLAPDGGEDALPLAPGSVGERIPQPPQIQIRDGRCGKRVVGLRGL